MQFNIKSAFIYGDLEETIYVKIPKGLDVVDELYNVCLLQNIVYELKQASRNWNKKFTEFLKRFGFKVCNSVGSVFMSVKFGRLIILVIFVDDDTICA